MCIITAVTSQFKSLGVFRKEERVWTGSVWRKEELFVETVAKDAKKKFLFVGCGQRLRTEKK